MGMERWKRSRNNFRWVSSLALVFRSDRLELISIVDCSFGIAPAMAGGFAAVLYLIAKYTVLVRKNPAPYALASGPCFMFLAAAVMTMSVIYKVSRRFYSTLFPTFTDYFHSFRVPLLSDSMNSPLDPWLPLSSVPHPSSLSSPLYSGFLTFTPRSSRRITLFDGSISSTVPLSGSVKPLPMLEPSPLLPPSLISV